LSLTKSHGLLWYHGRIYVPDIVNLHQDILFWHHDVLWMAYLGIDHTLHMAKAQFCWPHMHADIEQYVSSCVNCQSNKIDRRRRTSVSPVVPPFSCWRTLGVDLIVDLPRSQAGFKALCVLVYHLSKMVRIVPTTNDLSANDFAHLYTVLFPKEGQMRFPGQASRSNKFAILWAADSKNEALLDLESAKED
jgi:putative transposase